MPMHESLCFSHLISIKRELTSSRKYFSDWSFLFLSSTLNFSRQDFEKKTEGAVHKTNLPQKQWVRLSENINLI